MDYRLFLLFVCGCACACDLYSTCSAQSAVGSLRGMCVPLPPTISRVDFTMGTVGSLREFGAGFR